MSCDLRLWNWYLLFSTSKVRCFLHVFQFTEFFPCGYFYTLRIFLTEIYTELTKKEEIILSASCTNVDLLTDNVKDEENNLNGPSKILMQEAASRMFEDNEEIEVIMRQETENCLDTSVHEGDAQEYLPSKNESDNHSLELTGRRTPRMIV